MSTIFDLDRKSLRQLKRFMKNSPKEFRRATAGVINSLAFTTRRYDIENINRSMIVRNKRFVQSSIRVQTTRITDIAKQRSIVGTLQRGSFTGWAEQQHGTRTKQKKQHTIPGRAGSKAKRVPPRYRMKAGRKFLRSSTMNPRISNYRNERHRTTIFLAMMRRRKKEPFYIDKPIGKMRRGLYEYRGKRLVLLASVDNIRQPKRVRFRSQSIRSLLVRNDIKKIWTQQLNRIVSRRK